MSELDLVGIGVGPFNLSLSALLKKTPLISQFFEQKPSFSWHPGMMLNNAKLQIHYLKDLATCVDPSNPYTFLSYLVEKGRIYSFLNRKTSTISRQEYSNYLSWASNKLSNINWNEKVTGLKYCNKKFKIQTEKRLIEAKHISIGTGIKPYVPEKFIPLTGDTFFHNSEFKHRINHLDLEKKRIAVIGGGQSGAEIVDNLISQNNKPKEIIWASKRVNFQPLEDSCFSNELYTPFSVSDFYQLPTKARQKKITHQVLTSDGITQEFSDDLYNKIYDLKYVSSYDIAFNILPNRNFFEVKGFGSDKKEYIISLKNLDNDEIENYSVDIIILATGYRSFFPQCVQSFLQSITNDIDNFPLNFDYSLKWQHGNNNKIFLQNNAKHSHGVTDPNISIAAWRNSMIVNSVSNYKVYDSFMDDHILGKLSDELHKERTTILSA